MIERLRQASHRHRGELREGHSGFILWGNGRSRKKAANPRGRRLVGASIRIVYFFTWYTRSPASVFVDSILRPCFLAAVERKPLTLWACQSVALWISAKLAPLGRLMSARIFAPLLSARGVLASFFGAGLVALLPALASFFALAPLAAFWPLGAPFFLVAPFFDEAFSGATFAPRSATAAAFSVVVASAFVMVVSGRSFLRFGA